MFSVATHFNGRRVIALKQFKSGLLAVTGPFKLNGVPVKRVNSAYNMKISTVVDLKGVSVDSITDETFKRVKAPKNSCSHKFFAVAAPKSTTSDARKTLKKTFDGALLKNVSNKLVRKYLGARFFLTRNDSSHAVKF